MDNTISIHKAEIEAVWSAAGAGRGDQEAQTTCWQDGTPRYEESLSFYSDFISHVENTSASLKAVFDALAGKWHQDTDVASSVTEKIMHPSYLKIISLGSAVLPYILEDLSRQPSQWFVALETIAGVNPIPQGNFNARVAVQAWLSWGREHGYIR
jgi:hypothetical protein